MKLLKDALHAYLKMWEQAFNFKGRTTIKDYWIAWLINFVFIGFSSTIIVLPYGVVEELGLGYEIEHQVLAITGIPMLLIILYIFMVIIPMLAMEVRRYHDVGKSAGLFVLHIILSPMCNIGAILRIVTCVQKSVAYENVYGPVETEPAPTNKKLILRNIGISLLIALVLLFTFYGISYFLY